MSSTSTFLISCVILAACLLQVLAPAQANPLGQTSEQNDDRLPMGDDGSLFLAGNECGPDEYLASGSLPTCEPTCENPRPMCPKIFYSGVDYVPCFCKAPLVRDLATKRCVALSECPPQKGQPQPQPQSQQHHKSPGSASSKPHRTFFGSGTFI